MSTSQASGTTCLNSAQGIDLLHRLKCETAALHERVEKQLNVLDETLTLEAYESLLSTLYGFYIPLESRMWPVLDRYAPGLTEGRSKIGRLEDDLRVLGCWPESIQLCERLPAIETAIDAIGAMYVLEGATLGGQIICRHVQHLLQMEDVGIRFFRGYDKQTGAMWRCFRDWLTRRVAEDEHDRLVSSAANTFHCLSHWLDSRI